MTDPYEHETIEETGARCRALLAEMKRSLDNRDDTLDKIAAQLNLKAMCIAASNKSSDMTFECRLNMAGI